MGVTFEGEVVFWMKATEFLKRPVEAVIYRNNQEFIRKEKNEFQISNPGRLGHSG